MFTLLTAALIGNLIMLPCVLASPLSFFFGRRLTKQAQREREQGGPPDGPTEDGLAVPQPSKNVRRDSSHVRAPFLLMVLHKLRLRSQQG